MIETNELTKIYGSGREAVTAVDHVNLQIERGIISGILGPNGAGKTTLIMMLTGLVLPSSGSAKVFGYDIIKDSMKIRRKVGLLPEGFGFYDHLTARQNLNYIAALNDIPKSERDKRVNEALKAVALEEFADRKVNAFSRGMTQRLGIAQTLIKDPELLILDEPTAGVDPEGARVFKDLIYKLNEQEKTILICTHLLHEVGPLCNHVAIMHRGKFVVQGRVGEIVKRVMDEEGYRIEVEVKREARTLAMEISKLNGIIEVKERNDNMLSIKASKDVRAGIIKVASTRGVEILSIRRMEPSLEDIFMRVLSGRRR